MAVGSCRRPPGVGPTSSVVGDPPRLPLSLVDWCRASSRPPIHLPFAAAGVTMASMLRAAALGRRGMAGGSTAIAPIAPGAPLFPRPTGMMARLKGVMGASANALPPSYTVDQELLQEVRCGPHGQASGSGRLVTGGTAFVASTPQLRPVGRVACLS